MVSTNNENQPNPVVHGIHHVTCICEDPQENIDFYVRVMGLRLVKRSVNQDAPDTYHFFYADAEGNPGTDLTFFPWPRMAAGRPGVGETIEVSFAIPSGTLSYWKERLEEHGVDIGETETRFGETTLTFKDPHGMGLALVECDDERLFAPWEGSTVPMDRQLRGMHSVRVWERQLAPLRQLLTETMGLTYLGEDAGWHRFGAEGGGSGNLIEIKEIPDGSRGHFGVGSIHHVAWRMNDAEEEAAMRAKLLQAGMRPTEIIDRFWFKSVYFREPGGVLFELATDGPGFDVDEDPNRLGESLILPPWLEPNRESIEASLPPVHLPIKDA